MRTIIFIMLIFCLQATQVWAVRYYVDASVMNDTGNALTWATAKKNLYAVVPMLSEDDEVWVKWGIYKPIDTTSSFHITASNIAIYGGFSGTETSLDERPAVDPVSIKNRPINQRSILSGDFGGGNMDCASIITSGFDGTFDNYSILIDGFEIAHAKDDAIFNTGGSTDYGMHYQNLYFRDVAGAIHVQGNGHFIRHILCESLRPTTQWIFDNSYARSTWEDITINGDGITPLFGALTVDGFGSIVNVNSFHVNNVKLADYRSLFPIAFDGSAFINDLVVNGINVNSPSPGFLLFSGASMTVLNRVSVSNVNIIGTAAPFVVADSNCGGYTFDAMIVSTTNIMNSEFNNFIGMIGNAFEVISRSNQALSSINLLNTTLDSSCGTNNATTDINSPRGYYR